MGSRNARAGWGLRGSNAAVRPGIWEVMVIFSAKSKANLLHEQGVL